MGIDPISIATAAAIAGAAGGGVSAFGSYESGQAKAAADSYQAQVAANNAKIAEQNSKLDIQSGETAAFNQGLKTRAIVGQQKAAQGASGIDVNTGSASDVRAATAGTGMLDALTIRSDAAKKAYADEVQATSDTAQSQLDTAAASQDVAAGDLGAAGTLLSSASTVGGNYAKFQQNFAGVNNFNSGNPIY